MRNELPAARKDLLQLLFVDRVVPKYTPVDLALRGVHEIIEFDGIRVPGSHVHILFRLRW